MDLPALPPRTILIGTPQTCRALAAALATLPSPPPIDGMVTLDGAPSPSPVASGQSQVPLLGSVHTVGLICRQRGIKRAIITLPARHRAWHAEISRQLRAEGVAERVVRPLDEQLEETPTVAAGSITSYNGIDLAELVGRTPHDIDEHLVGSVIRGRTVLVTGAGGSIGSELVRRIARFAPERVVLMERSENALFEIDRQLAETCPGVARTALLHDVVDAERTLAHLERWKPHVVFHAAAHKHVPLMEDHPAHAVTNNLFGTKSIADAAVSCGAERFVLISTDKAVNPASVMGATKRLAEWYVQSLAQRVRTRMSMVRFGNVLGSNGSVLTIWAEQVARGGPITVTDERMTRYFMTIPEAATLVLQAGAMAGFHGRCGEVFVLDMGEPIPILTLAKRFVRACGLEPAVAGAPTEAGPGRIPIVLSGARPGEKLHEQLSYDAEELCTTAHPGIWRLDSEAAPAADAVEALVSDLDAARHERSRRAVLDAMARHMPTLRPPIAPVAA
ncbi:MAG: polysaccharide biosynthesis protein [Phycisphaerales bacterium]|nr:polysaccharide biosynthesis protein [Planctomycetota bacterium]MCH8509889.1 polysaccharide biosynthesis protein [Phycisphaerales bacterium]